jgi:hypothetical protein
MIGYHSMQVLSRIQPKDNISNHTIGAGAITRTWHFEYLTRDGDKEVLDIKVHEPTFIENDLGFKTWGSAPLLAR